MRILLLGLTAIALTACDSGQVPSPADRMAGEIPADTVDAGLVALHGEGVVAGAESFYFAAGRNEVENALTQALGDPVGRNKVDECGAGPMEMTSYPGELTLNFQSGSLVGWNIGVAPEGAGEGEGENILIDADVSIGMAADDLAEATGYAPIENSTLGEEFALSNTMGGFVDGGAVTMLYAGTQCFFR